MRMITKYMRAIVKTTVISDEDTVSSTTIQNEGLSERTFRLLVLTATRKRGSKFNDLLFAGAC